MAKRISLALLIQDEATGQFAGRLGANQLVLRRTDSRRDGAPVWELSLVEPERVRRSTGDRLRQQDRRAAFLAEKAAPS